MNHPRQVSEVQRYGSAMLRVDVPQKDGTMVTQFYGGSAVYCETPTSEENARKWLSNRYGWNEVHQLSLPEGTRSSEDDDVPW